MSELVPERAETEQGELKKLKKKRKKKQRVERTPGGYCREEFPEKMCEKGLEEGEREPSNSSIEEVNHVPCYMLGRVS